MLLNEVIEIYNLIDDANINGEILKEFFLNVRKVEIEVKKIVTDKGSTDFIRIVIPGVNGKKKGGKSRTLGVLGRLGGIGARPNIIGTVSDGDGAVVALSVALKLLKMQNRGDFLDGDVIVSTHICPNAPIRKHKPVDFMDSPVDIKTVNEEECNGEFDGILSIDTTKGNKIINCNGFAISPTVKEGYILKVSDDLLNLMTITTGSYPNVFALSTQDITPYGNGLYHLNSILQPAVATDVPVVGIAITSESVIPGCATGASNPYSIEQASRYVIEVCKEYGNGKIELYDENEFSLIVKKYGKMNHLQTLGNEG